MTRPYKDRDPDQKARAKANSARYARTPVGILRRKAKSRAMYQMKREFPDRYRDLFEMHLERLLEEEERDETRGLPPEALHR